MGEYADYILNGDDCQRCGQYIGNGDGYPRSCKDCSPNETSQLSKKRNRHARFMKRLKVRMEKQK